MPFDFDSCLRFQRQHRQRHDLPLDDVADRRFCKLIYTILLTTL